MKRYFFIGDIVRVTDCRSLRYSRPSWQNKLADGWIGFDVGGLSVLAEHPVYRVIGVQTQADGDDALIIRVTPLHATWDYDHYWFFARRFRVTKGTLSLPLPLVCKHGKKTCS